MLAMLIDDLLTGVREWVLQFMLFVNGNDQMEEDPCRPENPSRTSLTRPRTQWVVNQQGENRVHDFSVWGMMGRWGESSSMASH